MAGLIAGFTFSWVAALILIILGAGNLAVTLLNPSESDKKIILYVQNGGVILAIAWLLGSYWLPLGPANSVILNSFFVILLISIVIGVFLIFIRYYTQMLQWCLNHKAAFLSIPILLVLFGFLNWQGFERTFGWVANGFEKVNINIRTTSVYS
ncbi:MAG: hypothetical protein LAT57_06740, partial [Balneolales bacterium]|nr:hypothetical protein [Balneolales bacterium]